MEFFIKVMKGNISSCNKEVSIEIGKLFNVDVDIDKKVMEGNSKLREVKYVFILNFFVLKKVKIEFSVVFIAKILDKDTEGKE